jgi:hypothetical protein
VLSVVVFRISHPPPYFILEQEAADTRRFRPGLVLRPQEELEIERRARACRSELACIKKVFQGSGVDRVLLVAADVQDDRSFMSLSLLTVASDERPASRSRSISGPPEGLPAAFREDLGALLAAVGYPLLGRVTIDLAPPGAAARLDDKPHDEGRENAFTVEPGTHRVAATLPGYIPADQRVEVRAGVETRITVRLEPDDSSFLKSPLVWISLGSVAAIGASVAFLLLMNQKPGCICVETPGGMCTKCSQ